MSSNNLEGSQDMAVNWNSSRSLSLHMNIKSKGLTDNKKRSSGDPDSMFLGQYRKFNYRLAIRSH